MIMEKTNFPPLQDWGRDRTEKSAEIQSVRRNLSATESKIRDVGKTTKELKKKVKALNHAESSTLMLSPTTQRRSDEDILKDAAMAWRNLAGGEGGGGGMAEVSSSVSVTSDEEEEEKEKKKKDAKNAKTLRGAFENDDDDEDGGAFSDASSDTLSLDASIAAFVTKMAKDSAKKWRQNAAGGGGGGGGGGDGGGDQNQDLTRVKRLSVSASEGEPVSLSPEIL